jgi:hypothetical protein
MRKFYDGEFADNSGGPQKFNYTTYNEGAGFSLDIVPKNSNGFITIETTIVNHTSLIDAMKAQAAKNKEICDEIIAKADNFEKGM